MRPGERPSRVGCGALILRRLPLRHLGGFGGFCKLSSAAVSVDGRNTDSPYTEAVRPFPLGLCIDVNVCVRMRCLLSLSGVLFARRLYRMELQYQLGLLGLGTASRQVEVR